MLHFAENNYLILPPIELLPQDEQGINMALDISLILPYSSTDILFYYILFMIMSQLDFSCNKDSGEIFISTSSLSRNRGLIP